MLLNRLCRPAHAGGGFNHDVTEELEEAREESPRRFCRGAHDVPLQPEAAAGTPFLMLAGYIEAGGPDAACGKIPASAGASCVEGGL